VTQPTALTVANASRLALLLLCAAAALLCAAFGPAIAAAYL
jgi:hypothetical protein